MRILICTPGFYPQIGGLETINLLLANELSKRGWEVVVATPVTFSGEDNYRYKVVRNPGCKELIKWVKWCDLFVHNSIVIKYLFPLFFIRKPFIVVHHSCSFNWDQTENIQSKIKRLVSLSASNIVVSEAVAQNLRLPQGYCVIHNYYNSDKFRLTNPNVRTGFIYIGRLSYEKGVDLLLNAYSEYRKRGGIMDLTIVGDGYLRGELETLSDKLGISGKVIFLGQKNSDELVDILNSKRTLILPSVCNEAFGIVILEAMACGCYCIGSDGDGIQEAMGSLGTLFRKSNIDSLTEAMLSSDLVEKEAFDNYQVRVTEHLKSFSLEEITSKYEKRFMSQI